MSVLPLLHAHVQTLLNNCPTLRLGPTIVPGDENASHRPDRGGNSLIPGRWKAGGGRKRGQDDDGESGGVGGGATKKTDAAKPSVNVNPR